MRTALSLLCGMLLLSAACAGESTRSTASAASTARLSVDVVTRTSTAAGQRTATVIGLKTARGRTAVAPTRERHIVRRLAAGTYALSAERRRCRDARCRRLSTTVERCSLRVVLHGGERHELIVRSGRSGRCVIERGPASPTGATPSDESGVRGTVTRREGNCMPGPAEAPQGSCSFGPVSRRVLVFQPPLPLSDFDGPVYGGSATPVAETTSAADGRFSVAVAPGPASVLVMDDGERYCQLFDTQHACPVRIPADGMAAFDPVIDRSAV